MTRRPLNKLFRRAVQCRDQFVVDRLVDRSHPNKVSMKKKEKGEEDRGEQGVFKCFQTRASAKRDLVRPMIYGHVRANIANTANDAYYTNLTNIISTLLFRHPVLGVTCLKFSECRIDRLIHIVSCNPNLTSRHDEKQG
jgi:hypothetical protein